MKIARWATRRPAVVTFGHAYHGRTLLTMSMTAKNVPYKDGFGPFAPEIYRAPLAYPFRWSGDPDQCGPQALAALEDLVLKQIGPNNTAAIVIEPIQGEGGFIVPPPGYLRAVSDLARVHGIVFVADEVQTGIARTGDMFACEHEDVVPDLVVTAKGLAGGLPLAGVTGRAELMDAVPPGGLGGTFSGNPIACAAALGVFETIEELQLVQRARRIEAVARPVLEDAATACASVGEVRGRGAMLAVEFVRPGTTDPAPEAAAVVVASVPPGGRPRPAVRDLRQRDPPATPPGHGRRPPAGRARRPHRLVEGPAVNVTALGTDALTAPVIASLISPVIDPSHRFHRRPHDRGHRSRSGGCGGGGAVRRRLAGGAGRLALRASPTPSQRRARSWRSWPTPRPAWGASAWTPR